MIWAFLTLLAILASFQNFGVLCRFNVFDDLHFHFYKKLPPSYNKKKINLGAVDPTTGKLKPSWGVLGNWQRNYTIETVLDQLRRDMATYQNRKLPQPPEGAMYPQ